MRSNNRILIRLLISAMVLVGLTLQTGMVYAEGESETTLTTNKIMGFTSQTTNQDIIDTWGPDVATIEQEGEAYKVTLLKDITLTKPNGPIAFGNYSDPLGKDQPRMILDLNGHTVTSTTIVIANYGNLTIKDSAGGGKVLMDNTKAYLVAVQNAGYEMIVESGTFECRGANSWSNNAAINTTSTTKLAVYGGVFEGNGGSALLTTGEVEIHGGEFNGKYGVVAKLGGNFEGSTDGVITFAENSSAEVNTTAAALVVQGNADRAGTINVKGGTFHSPSVAGKSGDDLVVTDAVSVSGGIYDVSPMEFVANETAAASCVDATTNETSYAVGKKDITRMANEAADESVLDVVQGDVELTGLDNVTVQNSGGGTVSVNGVTVTEEPVEVHTLELVKGQQPTCTEAGWKDYYRCTGTDGKLFSDAQAQNEITIDIEEWKRTDGRLDVVDHALELQKGQAPTCTTPGWSDYYRCTNEVNRYFSDAAGQNEITNLAEWKLGAGALAVTKHNLALQKGKAPTCTEAGWNDYYMCTNETDAYFEDAEGQTKIADLEDWKLGAGALAVTDHTYEWVIDKEATTTETGLKHEECTVCGDAKEAVTIPLKPTKPSNPSDIPETGDSSGVIPWVILLVLAGAGLAYASIANQKKKEEE